MQDEGATETRDSVDLRWRSNWEWENVHEIPDYSHSNVPSLVPHIMLIQNEKIGQDLKSNKGPNNSIIIPSLLNSPPLKHKGHTNRGTPQEHHPKRIHLQKTSLHVIPFRAACLGSFIDNSNVRTAPPRDKLI